MFEMNDGRYWNFEGLGVFGTYQFDLNTDPDKILRLFDYNTIADLILEIKYTAMEDLSLEQPVQTYLKNLIANTSAATLQLWRGFSLKQDFANEWFKMLHPAAAGGASKMTVAIDKTKFPYLAQNRNITLKAVHLYAMINTEDTYSVSVDITSAAAATSNVKFTLQNQPVDSYHDTKNNTSQLPARFDITITRAAAPLSEQDLKDIVLILEYQLTP
jgi:hypothetical protein